MSRPETDCSPNKDGEDGYFYAVYFVQNTGNAARKIQISADWLDEDGYLHVYDNSAEPRESLASCIVGNDDDPSASIFQSQIDEVDIAAGEILRVVVSTFEPGITIDEFNLTITTLLEQR